MIRAYVISAASGVLRQTLEMPEASLPIDATSWGPDAIVIPYDGADFDTVQPVVGSGGDIAFTARAPDPALELAAARARRWTLAKAHRDTRMLGGFSTAYGRVQTDQISQNRISSAASAAKISKDAGLPFAVNWTLEDNSVVTIDADGMVALGFAVLGFVAACQDAGTAIRKVIEVAATLEQVAAVDITAGYPPA